MGPGSLDSPGVCWSSWRVRVGTTMPPAGGGRGCTGERGRVACFVPTGAPAGAQAAPLAAPNLHVFTCTGSSVKARRLLDNEALSGQFLELPPAASLDERIRVHRYLAEAVGRNRRSPNWLVR